jgi:hypothetical protein
MISRSYEIRPETLADSFGGVTSCYDVLSIDLTGQVAMVCVSRLLDNTYGATHFAQDQKCDPVDLVCLYRVLRRPQTATS